jgi:hypothetical protein
MGLIFVCYQQGIARQLVTVQTRLIGEPAAPCWPDHGGLAGWPDWAGLTGACPRPAILG